MKKLLVLLPLFLLSCGYVSKPAGTEGLSSETDASDAVYADEKAAQVLLSSTSLIYQVETLSGSPLSAPAPSAMQIPNLALWSGVPSLSTVKPNLLDFQSSWLKISADTGGDALSSPSTVDLISDSLSIFAIVNTESRGNILSFHPSDRFNQSFSLDISASNFSASFFSSPSDHLSGSVALPANTQAIVGALFTNDESTLDLYVQGVKNSTTLKTGTTLSPFEIPRILSVGPIVASQTLKFKALYVFKRRLTGLEAGAVIRSLARRYEVTGLAMDPSLGSTPSGGTQDLLFPQVKTIIQAQCASCHSSWSSASANYFVANNLVVKKNALASPFYYRLQGSLGGSGPKTMPQGTALSPASVDLIKQWIDSL